MTVFSAAEARRYTPGGIHSSNRRVPSLDERVIVRAHGQHIWTSDGNQLLDLHCGSGPVILGHAHEEVDAAAAAGARRLSLSGLIRTDLEIELAEALVRLVPSFESVLFCSSGSEGTYHAVRLARAATGRTKLVKFLGGYHGWHDGVAVDFVEAGSDGPVSMSAGSLASTLEQTISLPFNDVHALQRLFLEQGTEIAGVIVEPVMHNIGVIRPQPGFLETLRLMCSASGTVLIFDEVITGIRHGLGGYQSTAGVIPDLTVLGKALGNGYPIAAVGGKTALMENFSTRKVGGALFLGTYNGHPGSVGAALKTIELYDEASIRDQLFLRGEALVSALQGVVRDLDVPCVVVGLGSVFAIYFQREAPCSLADALSGRPELAVQHREQMIARGVFEIPRVLARSAISAAHTEADLERIVSTTEDCLSEARPTLFGGVEEGSV
jgi:glutamate-1-semialdehyde 2,1-aminomutase